MGNDETTTSTETLETALTEEAKVATEETKEAQEVKAESEKTETPKEETITPEALAKAIEEAKATVKGGYEGTVKKMREDIQKLEQAHQQALARAAELEQQTFLKQVESSGGDMTVAQQIIARAKATAAREQELATQASTLAEQKAQLDVLTAELNKAALGKLVGDLITQYNLPKTAATELATASNPTEMKLKAVEMAFKQTKIAAKPATKVAAEGASGNTGVDFDKLSPREKIEFALKNTE